MVFKTPKYTKGNEMNPKQSERKVLAEVKIFYSNTHQFCQLLWDHYPNNSYLVLTKLV